MCEVAIQAASPSWEWSGGSWYQGIGNDGKNAFSARAVAIQRDSEDVMGGESEEDGDATSMMTERAPSARVKLQYIGEAFKRGVVRGHGSAAQRDDGKSAFGVSEVAIDKRSFQKLGGSGRWQ